MSGQSFATRASISDKTPAVLKKRNTNSLEVPLPHAQRLMPSQANLHEVKFEKACPGHSAELAFASVRGWLPQFAKRGSFDSELPAPTAKRSNCRSLCAH